MSGLTVGPDPLVLGGNLAKNYEIFEEQFSKFYESKKYLHDLPENEKISFFLLTIGKSAREIYDSFNLPSDDSSVTLETVMDRFKMYCKSHKDNSVYHSYKFYSRNQEKDESFENYLKDIFDLAKPCHFNYDRETIERLIRDKIILGLNDTIVREEIFSMGFSKLDEIVNYCLTREKNEPDVGKEKNQEFNQEIIKTEKIDEEAGKEGKNEELGNETDKNSGNAVTSSNDVLPMSEEPISPDNSVLEKGEVSTSSLYENAHEGHSRNNSPLCTTSKLQNAEEGMAKPSTPDTNVVDESSSCENKIDKLDADSISSIENKNSNGLQEVITIDHSDNEDDRRKKPRLDEVKKPPAVINLKNSPVSKNNTFFKCVKCGAAIKEQEALYKHIASCTATSSDVNIVPIKFVKCSLCATQFRSQESLDAHLLIHRSPKANRYACNLCGKDFDRESKLSAHKAVTHGIQRLVYDCPKCPKKFEDELNFNKHLTEHKVVRSRPKSKPKPRSKPKLQLQPKPKPRLSLGNTSSSDQEGLFRCALCRNHFKDYESLANHTHY